jgi:translation initiation factor IF-1
MRRTCLIVSSPQKSHERLGLWIFALDRFPQHLKNMPTDSSIVIEGKITSVLPGTMFRVELSNNHLVLAHISGKMRKRFIRLTVGDRVKMEMSPYDVSKARIVYRLG